MLQETFEAHMQIHYGIEGQATKEKCEKFFLLFIRFFF
jgi:hypothetical protein